MALDGAALFEGALDKPVGGQLRDALQGPGFFEEMSGAGNDFQFHFAVHSSARLFVQLNHDIILAADDEQGGGLHEWQRSAGEIGPAAARDDGADIAG